MFKETPIQIYMKPSTGGGPGGGLHITRPTRREKLYHSNIAIYVYPNGKVEIGKNKNGDHGEATVEQAIKYFSKNIADLKLKDTHLDMIKEGLSKLLQESINNTLKGDYYERSICTESSGDGFNCDRGT